MFELILCLASLSLFLGWLVWFLIKRRKEMKQFNNRMTALSENLDTHDLIKSGYAGTLSNGNIVDRRLHPEAFILPENSYMGIPKPKKL